MTIMHPDHPKRRAGKSKVRVTYTWGRSPQGEALHCFVGLSCAHGGRSMCGKVVVLDDPIPALFCKVCSRCREYALPGKPLPRGMM
jgi:hypothetical protein